MPIYEFTCRDCGHRFEKIVRVTAEPKCPHCQGANLEQQFSVFAVGGRRGASAVEPRLTSPCGTCADPRGPGSCSLD